MILSLLNLLYTAIIDPIFTTSTYIHIHIQFHIHVHIIIYYQDTIISSSFSNYPNKTYAFEITSMFHPIVFRPNNASISYLLVEVLEHKVDVLLCVDDLMILPFLLLNYSRRYLLYIVHSNLILHLQAIIEKKIIVFK